MDQVFRVCRVENICTFYNSYFLIFSSMGSFYIPCMAMLGLYWKMFSTIRQRARQSMLRRRQTRNVMNADVRVRDEKSLNDADKKIVRALELFNCINALVYLVAVFVPVFVT